jgi:hydroxymethylbilane synthase
MNRDNLIVGTRKSALALVQTQGVIAALEKAFLSENFEIQPIVTKGDTTSDKACFRESTGLFVKEIEDALLKGEIDLAVHSLKDMPCELPAGVELGAVLKREDPRDAFLTRGGVKFKDLPSGARIATSSVRRRAEILAARPDLVVAEMRGNVDTRLRKLRSGETDALVIAVAGLVRLGEVKSITERLPFDIMLPAPCQGALAVEIRRGDERVKNIVKVLDHAPTRACVDAERSLLKSLGAGCSLPVGALAMSEDNLLILRARVISPDGKKKIDKSIKGATDQASVLGEKLAKELLNEGGSWVKEVLSYKA